MIKSVTFVAVSLGLIAILFIVLSATTTVLSNPAVQSGIKYLSGG